MNAPSPIRSLLYRLQSAEQAREAPNDANHPRLHKRFVVRGDALLHPMNRSRLDTTPVDVKLRDISRSGIGFICSEPLPAHSSWRVEFQLAGYGIGDQALIIKHVSEVGDGMYLCGAEFVLDTALLALLGIDPALIEQTENPDETVDADDSDFLPPEQVA